MEIQMPGKRFLAIQHNSDGRPCGWGLSPDRDVAEAEAKRQYGKHHCYSHEKPGKLEVVETNGQG